MEISTHDFQVGGVMLHRTVFNPSSTDAVMACLFSHGQGDFSERYADVLHPFTERGIRCISVDLLGHGKSPGKRGHCGDQALINSIIKSNLEFIGDLPHGIAGHSMGGLLTLRHLSMSLKGELPRPSFCWINSPLLQPAHNKPSWFVTLAKILANIAPNLTINTGATPELCQTLAEKKPNRHAKIKAKKGHQRVSLGWGKELLEMSESVYQYLPDSTDNIPFLFTQGDNDYICPHTIAESFFGMLQLRNKQFQLLKNMRHETFAEPNNEDLFEVIRQWLDHYKIPSQ